MSLGPRTLTFIEAIAAACGMIAATIVATAQPQPAFGMAFWLYVVSAIIMTIICYKKKMYPMMLLFIYYVFLDSYGVYNWWPY